MKQIVILWVFVCSNLMLSFGQNLEANVLSFQEYLALVKKYHPVVKQAQLVIDEGQANLLRSRGAFDPKIEVDYARKKFENTEYFHKLNAAFKIPTWYGIELKANFEEASGDFLNPEMVLPEDGLYSAGISFSAAQGLLINERMATLKQARLFTKQAQADRDIFVNNILYEAALAYFDWLKSYANFQVYQDFLSNAQLRFDGIKQSVEEGERAAIDSVEARIVLNNRKLNLEKSRVVLLNKQLELANFLWLENNIPLELQDDVIPDENSILTAETVLGTTRLENSQLNIEEHPKIRSLNFKYDGLEVDKRLKTNKLLPRVDLEYNFLFESYNRINTFNNANYKSGVSVRFPLFLRKERGDLKLAKLKLQDTKYELDATKLTLQNKIRAVQAELASYVLQLELLQTVVDDYVVLLAAEERKFNLGESSIFLVNSRETKLIEAKLKLVELNNTIANTKARYFNILAVNPVL